MALYYKNGEVVDLTDEQATKYQGGSAGLLRSGWSTIQPNTNNAGTNLNNGSGSNNDFVGNFKDFQSKLGVTPDAFDYASEQTKAQEAEAARLAAMRAAITAQANRERETAQGTAVKREGGRKALLGISEGLNATSYGQDYVEQVDNDLNKELKQINDLETEALANAQYTSADKLSQQLTALRTQRDQVNQKIIDNFKLFQDYQKTSQPSDINDYNFYVEETKKTGGTPLSYFEWKSKLNLGSAENTKEVGGVLYEKQSDGSWKAVTTPTTKTSEPITKLIGKTLYQYDDKTGKWNVAVGGATNNGVVDKETQNWEKDLKTARQQLAETNGADWGKVWNYLFTQYGVPADQLDAILNKGLYVK